MISALIVLQSQHLLCLIHQARSLDERVVGGISRASCRQPRQWEEEDYPDLSEEEKACESAENRIIVDGFMRHREDPRSNGNRYAQATWLWAFELLRTSGPKTFCAVRFRVSVPSA
jgi:hypothetical protein